MPPRSPIRNLTSLEFDLLEGNVVTVKAEHKHLGMILDSKLDFQSHTKEAIIKAMRGIGMIR